MPHSARSIFWARTKALTLALLCIWLAVNLAVPWLARELNGIHLLGFPLGYWLAAEGALVIYLLIIVTYVWGMDRLEAEWLADQEREHPAAAAELTLHD